VGTVGERLAELGRALGERPALIGSRGGREESLTWAELDRRTARWDGDRDRVLVVPAGNDVASAVAILRCLRAGVTVLPLDPRAGAAHREGVDRQVGRLAGAAAGYLLCTAGSTGQPKLVHRPGAINFHPYQVPNPILRRAGFRTDQRQLLVIPVHHAAGFMAFLEGVLSGNTLVLQADFVAHTMWELAARHEIDWLLLTPTHMRVALAPALAGGRHTAMTLLHTGDFCEPELKQAWIDLLGEDRVFEMYGSTEAVGATVIRGDEWRSRPGSVGRPVAAQIRILDDNYGVLPPRQIGEVYLRTPRRAGDARPAGIVGQRHTPDGFVSVGDRGWLDDDGYLYLAGRRDDLIIVGGENVYPAEIEAVVRRLPGVRDAAVIGAPDPLLGQHVVVCVVPEPVDAPDRGRVLRHCAEWLSLSKLPKDVRYVAELPRTATGKVQRWRLHNPP
jgi:bile acid-coenzyme A ligase